MIQIIRTSIQVNSSDDEDNFVAPSFSQRGNDETFLLPQNSVLMNMIGLKDDRIDVSWETIHYVDMLTTHMPNTICPLRVPGDGNCLLHSISVALWGNIMYHDNLRDLLREELTQNEEFYRKSVDKSKEDEESQGLTSSEYEKIIGDANSSHASLGFIHIFALSNILKRPIIVYASQKDMMKWGVHEEGVAGTFLPTRHGAGECNAKSIALGWSNEDKNHFVPICPIEETHNEWDWPQLEVVFKKTLKQKETVDHYISNSNFHTLVKKFVSVCQDPRKRQREGDVFITKHSDTSRETRTSYHHEDDPMEVAKQFLSDDSTQIENLVNRLNHKREEVLITKGLTKVTPMARKKPSNSCREIPMTFYIIMTMPEKTIPNLLKKILQFNEELKNLHKLSGGFGTSSIYTLDDKEVNSLQNLVNVLKSPKLSFATALFKPEALDLVLYMLSWPLDKLFSALDLIRVLLLHESAASYISKMKDENISLLSILLICLKIPDLQLTLLQICLKTIINLFSHPCYNIVLIMSAHVIVNILVSLISKMSFEGDGKNDRITIKLCSQIFQNFALLWHSGPPFRPENHYDTVKILIKTACTLLHHPALSDADDIKISLLIALGTLVQSDNRIRIPNKKFEPFLNSQNATLRDCSKYIIGD